MNLVDLRHDIAKYFRGLWTVIKNLPKAKHYAEANDMSTRGFLRLSYRLGRTNKTNELATEVAECGQCYRIPGGEKLRLMGWRCPEHGLAHFHEGEG